MAEIRTEQWPTELEHQSAAEILAWAARFAPRVAFGTGFGAEGCVLVHLIAAGALPIDVFTLDTGLLFPETNDLWQRLERRYGLHIRGVQPALSLEEQAARHGDALWEREPDRCCGIRKVAPLQPELADVDAWITAIRRDQTPERARILSRQAKIAMLQDRFSEVLPSARAALAAATESDAAIVERDDRSERLKINPLAAWTTGDVWAFIRANGVPYNPLYDRGYSSIGCAPCTTAVLEGEAPRAGRWRGREKTECGLHVATTPLPLQLFPSSIQGA